MPELDPVPDLPTEYPAPVEEPPMTEPVLDDLGLLFPIPGVLPMRAEPVQYGRTFDPFDLFDPFDPLEESVHHSEKNEAHPAEQSQDFCTRPVSSEITIPLIDPFCNADTFQSPWPVNIFPPLESTVEEEENSIKSSPELSGEGDRFTASSLSLENSDQRQEICTSSVHKRQALCPPKMFDQPSSEMFDADVVAQDMHQDRSIWTGVLNAFPINEIFDVEQDQSSFNQRVQPRTASQVSPGKLNVLDVEPPTLMGSLSPSSTAQIQISLTPPPSDFPSYLIVPPDPDTTRSQEKEIHCVHCSAITSDVFKCHDGSFRCSRCETYHRRHGIERPQVLIEGERKRLPRECINCTTTTSRQWRCDEDGSVLCSECGNYLTRTGRPRPFELALKYLAKKNALESRIRKPRKTIRFKKADRVCSNCQTCDSSYWRAGPDLCCLCNACWSYCHRTKKARPRRLWPKER